MNKFILILLTFLLIAGGVALIYYMGIFGVCLFILVIFGFLLILYGLHRRRMNRLIRSIMPSESQVAAGVVSDGVLKETPAVLARGPLNT